MTAAAEPYDRIAAALAAGGARLVAAVVPDRTPWVSARDRLVSELASRDQPVVAVPVDEAEELAEAVARGKAVADGGPLLVHGFEDTSTGSSEEFLRRSNFQRARLANLAQATLLVMPADTWAWLANHLPDLARWCDGPFLLPPADSSESLDTGLRALQPKLGRPLPHRLDIPLEAARGIDLDTGTLVKAASRQLILLAAPRGTGLTHIATRVQQHLVKIGLSAVWPPSRVIVNGQLRVGPPNMVPGDPRVPFPKRIGQVLALEEWLKLHSDDILLLPRDWVETESLMRLASRHRGIVLGPYAQFESAGHLDAIYVPPVVVEKPHAIPILPSAVSERVRRSWDAYLNPRGWDFHYEPVEAGIATMELIVRTKLAALGREVDDTIAAETLREVAQLSGGLPGACLDLLSRASAVAQRMGSSLIGKTALSVAAVDLARSIQHAHATATRGRGAGSRSFDTWHDQVVLIEGEPVETTHPLVRALPDLVERTR